MKYTKGLFLLFAAAFFGAVFFVGVGNAAAVNFSENVQVNIDAGNLKSERDPVISVDKNNGNIYIAWMDHSDTETISFSRSVDGGATFSAPARINDNVTYPPTAYSGSRVGSPEITLDNNGNIYVVWTDYRAWTHGADYGKPIDIYIDKSTDGGATWGSDVKVSNGSGTYKWHFRPGVAARDSYVYVSFSDYNSYHLGDPGNASFARSVDGGSSFEPQQSIDDSGMTVAQSFPSVKVDPAGNVYVAFSDLRKGRQDVYIAKSTDNGQTFGSNIQVNDVETLDQEEPHMAIDNAGNIYVAWKDWRDDLDRASAPYLNHIYMAKSTNSGSSFAASVRVTDEYMSAQDGYNNPPRIAVTNSGGVHVVWHDARAGFSSSYHDVSEDGGLTFTADTILSSGSTSVIPKVDIDDQGNPNVAFIDKRNGNDKYDVFFAKGGSLTDIIPPVTNATPLGGTYSEAQTVLLNVNEEATTYYTLDGSTPTTASLQYENPISISTSTTLKYFSIDLALNAEDVNTDIYEIRTNPITIEVPADYLTIQAAIDSAIDGDTIQVAAGTYQETFVVDKDVKIIGAGLESTTIDGNGTSPIIRFEDYVNAEISGFSIINGKPGYNGVVGQDTAIFCMTYSNLIIKDNSIHAGSPFGIEFAGGANPSQVIRNRIHGHSEYGVSISNASPVIENNLIFDNGAGIYSWNASAQPKIRNNVIMTNWKGIGYRNNSIPIIENNIIFYNATFGIGEEYADNGYYYNYNDVFENGDNMENYFNAKPGTGALSEDPLFEDVSGFKFRLQRSSSAINAGNPSSIFNDPDGTRNDMGLYGGPNAEPLSDATPPITTADPPAGTYASAQTVTLSVNEAATIYYLVSVPSISEGPWQTHTGPSVDVAIDQTATLKYYSIDTAGNGESTHLADYVISTSNAESFENGFGGWIPDHDDKAPEFRVELSAVQAFEGVKSVELFIDGSQDDGTAWIEKEIDVLPNENVAVNISFRLWSAAQSDMNQWQVKAYAGLTNPEVEHALPIIGNTNEAAGWKEYTYETIVRSDANGKIWIAVGISCVWEIARSYYIDFVSVETSESVFSFADVNRDGFVNIKDIQLCVKAIVNPAAVPQYVSRCKAIADLKNIVNIKDIQAIVKAIIGG